MYIESLSLHAVYLEYNLVEQTVEKHWVAQYSPMKMNSRDPFILNILFSHAFHFINLVSFSNWLNSQLFTTQQLLPFESWLLKMWFTMIPLIEYCKILNAYKTKQNILNKLKERFFITIFLWNISKALNFNIILL
jgi:hypothetical protein